MKGRGKAGRPSKLTEQQWAEAGRRLAQGESYSTVAKAMRVAKSTLVGRFSDRMETIKSVATRLSQAESDFERLPISDQISARTIADQLKSIQNHLISAAHSGAETASIMSDLASRQARQLRQQADKGEKFEPEEMRPLAAMIEVSNKAASTGMGLMQIGKKDGQPIDDGEKAIRDMSDEDLKRLVRRAAEDSR